MRVFGVLAALASCAGASGEREAIVVSPSESSEPDPRLSPEPRPRAMSPLALAPSVGSLPSLADDASAALVEAHRLSREVREKTPLPEAPDAHSMEDVRVWSAAEFTQWLRARQEAVTAAQAALGELTTATAPHELAVAAGLNGRLSDELQEDLLRATLIPDEIAADDQLLTAYAGAIWNMARALLERAAEGLRMCAERIQQAPAGWEPWRDHCKDRTLVIEHALANPPDLETLRRRIAASR